MAGKAVDGDRNSDFLNGSCSHTLDNTDYTPTWWMVDLGEDLTVTNVIITSRDEGSMYIFLVWIFSKIFIYASSILGYLCYASQQLDVTFLSNSVPNRDFSPSTIAVGPSASTSNFNELDFPHVCANITQPFGFPETRNSSCNM